MRYLLFTLLIYVAGTFPVYAEFKAADLQLLCSDKGGELGNQICQSWVNGFAAGLLSAESLARTQRIKPAICVPDDLNGEKMRNILILYIEHHPMAASEYVTPVAAVAAADAFPCKNPN